MEAKELNRLRLKAEIILDKANELIRFINMNENTESCIKRHGDLLGATAIKRWTREVNRRNVIIESLKNDLECIK